MTVKVEVIEGGVPHNKILIAGVLCTLVCLYLSYLNVLTNTEMFSFFGGLAAVAALIWGSHTIKVLCSYGIGTGVPSAGMIAFGSGVIAMLLATKFGIAAPIVALVLAAIIGLILGYLANEVLNMKIPAMIQALTELAVVGALTLMGFAVLITGSFTFAGLTTGSMTLFGALSLPSYQVSFIGGGLTGVAFLLGAIAIQHPFNACLGPGWKQDRMLMLTAECGFLSMIVAAIMSFALVSAGSAIISLIIALVGWLYTYCEYIRLSKRDAFAWLDSKPIPEVEGH
ncbi:tetrahydromethanopterin S-methyltransferase subunit MtrC [Methanoregula sp.]|uniref:tetrahydromethanopterin S-methyltransferase subunit MtrC n=1 Tax=Methanoregula sp. TaxID=2052170 RepID=UPI002CC1B850|nr:tetrahydromethanopterin S-methyltransferase subunit C [Methanoregula sp.]HVP95778.1 tetrahydromethanopterin S-methyltransferase subunit C [Methanoregula sp.]